MFAQIRPWKDCDRGCDFCYLRNEKNKTTLVDKKKALMKMSMMIKSEMGGYDTIGIIGGELFCWDGLDTEWNCVAEALSSSNATTIYIASHLFGDITPILNFINKIKGKDIQICTSYDSVGRIRNDIEMLKWMKNLERIHTAGYKIVCSCTMTESFVTDPIEFPSWIDLTIQPIFITEDWLQTITENYINGEEYNKLLNDMKDDTIDLANRKDVLKWFIKHPQSAKKYGVYDNKHATHFWDYIDGQYIRSDFICDRRTDCGHPYIARCYKNDSHCSMCDAKKVIE